MGKYCPKKIDEKLIECEIRRSQILPDNVKDEVVRQLLLELGTINQKTWFRCKMILFRNRYNKIEKEVFFKWLYGTHLLELIDLRRGGIDLELF